MKPSSPVAQNGQPTAQPAWLEMHSVCRSRLAAAGRVVHQHRLDERAVIEPVERLLGQAAVGEAELRVGDRVEPERLVEPVRSGGRQRRDRRGVVDAAAAPHRIARPGGRGRPARRGASSHARRSSGVRPESPGRSSDVTRSMLAQPAHSTGTTALPTIPGRPRTNASQDIRLAAGRLDLHEPEPVAVAAVPARRHRTRPAAGRPRRRPGSRATRQSRPDGRLDERARPRLVGADLALELRRGSAGIQPSVLAAERPRRRRAIARSAGEPSISPASHGSIDARRAGDAPTSASRASSSRGVSVPSRAMRT